MTGTATARARTGGLVAGATLIVVGGLQAAERLIGSFNPRIEVMIGMAVAILATTALLQRLRSRDRQQDEAGERGERLRKSLRFWPPATMQATAGEALGLYPARRDLGDGYVPRSADPALREALNDHRLVVVTGPRGAGKTRSAIEAVKDGLPEALVVVPRDRSALRELLELDPDLSHAGDPGTPRVLWLDNAQRYLRALDVEALARLMSATVAIPEGRSRGVTVVATIRDVQWQRALASDTAEGETAKSLLARAKVVELPLALDPEESRAASRRYRELDLSEGIGRAVASTGGESGEPPSPPEVDARAEKPLAIDGPSRARDDRPLLAALSAALLALAVIGGFALTGHFAKTLPPSIADQADAARRQGGAGTREAVESKQIDFHGLGEDSYFFTFRDGEDTPSGEERADRIEVWDRHGNDLDRVFAFEPSEPAVFQLRYAGDIDGDGAAEVVGGYGTRLIPGELLVPFALDWNTDGNAYRIISLAPNPPPLPAQASGAGAAELQQAYERQLTFNDERDRLSLSGFPTQDFSVDPNLKRLISAFVTHVGSGEATRDVELEANIFDATAGHPLLHRCHLSGNPPATVRVPSSNSRLLHNAALERWQQISKKRFCVVQL
jgi:hypothetical protein